MDKDVKKLLRKAPARGFEVIWRDKRPQLRHPATNEQYSVSPTPSDYRALRNVEAWMRRCELKAREASRAG